MDEKVKPSDAVAETWEMAALLIEKLASLPANAPVVAEHLIVVTRLVECTLFHLTMLTRLVEEVARVKGLTMEEFERAARDSQKVDR